MEIPHPDDIKYHTNSSLDCSFIEQTFHIFSAQFWREKDEVEICEGDFTGMMGTLGDIDLAKRTAVVVCDDHAFDCSLRELRRKFSLGNAVKIIAGPFGGDTGYVVAVREDTIAVAIIQENGTSDDVSYYKSLCSILTNCIGRSI